MQVTGGGLKAGRRPGGLWSNSGERCYETTIGEDAGEATGIEEAEFRRFAEHVGVGGNRQEFRRSPVSGRAAWCMVGLAIAWGKGKDGLPGKGQGRARVRLLISNLVLVCLSNSM